jgi:hypothetical protein
MNIRPTSDPAVAQQAATAKQPAKDNIKGEAAPATQKPKASPAQPTDAVQVSNLAQQALQEATETKAQTLREAQGGDIQAKKLLAREAAK